MRIELGLESIDKAQIALHHAFGITHDWTRVQEGQMVRWVRGEPLDRSVHAFSGVHEAQNVYWDMLGDGEGGSSRASEEFVASVAFSTRWEPA